jgi:hypothetical protein
MHKKLAGALATLVLIAAPIASASTILIDFTGFGYGVGVDNYYNGGTDSLGRSGGPNYGISFSGIIRNTPRGAYLAGPQSMRINPEVLGAYLGSDQYYISFNAGRYDIDGGFAFISFENGNVDGQWIAGNGNPYCGKLPGACDNPYRGLMGGYAAGPWGNSQINGISFNADRVDNVVISTSPVRVSGFGGSYEMDRDIPEPASIALVGIGAAALAVRRRKKAASRLGKHK